MITLVIGPDNRVAPRTVTIERIVGQTAYLSDGAGRERVVTDGQIRLAPGAAVTVEELLPAALASRRHRKSGA